MPPLEVMASIYSG